MLIKIFFSSLLVLASLFAKVTVDVFQIKDNNYYLLDSADVVFSGDYLKFKFQTDRNEDFTFVYTRKDGSKQTLFTQMLQANKVYTFPAKDNGLKLDNNTGIIKFIFKDSIAEQTFMLRHISSHSNVERAVKTTAKINSFSLLDKRKYIDYSTIKTNSRGSKEKEIWSALQKATVIIKTLAKDSRSVGAGIIIEKGNYILTNHHVVDANFDGVYVAFKPKLGNKPSKNNYYKTTVVKVDLFKDLALLKVDKAIMKKQNFRSLKLARMDALEVGEDIYNMGHPIGYFYTPGNGMIKNISNDFSWSTHTASYVIQHSIPTSKGSSGGPIVNAKLELVGIGAFSNNKGQNLNFGISSIDIKAFLDSKSNIEDDEMHTLNSLDHYIIKTGFYKGKIKTAKLDINQNGTIDALLFDKDNDGRWDLIKYDKNEDGIIEKVTNY